MNLDFAWIVCIQYVLQCNAFKRFINNFLTSSCGPVETDFLFQNKMYKFTIKLSNLLQI